MMRLLRLFRIGLLDKVSQRSDSVDMGLATVLAATVTGLITIIGILVSFRRENHADHAIVVDRLDSLNSGLNRVETKVDSHITDHARGMM